MITMDNKKPARKIEVSFEDSAPSAACIKVVGVGGGG